MPELESRLEELLKDHDWYFIYSDDHRVFKRGWGERDEIISLVKSLGDKGKEIYNQYAPKGNKIVTESESLSDEEEKKKDIVFNKLKSKKRDFVKQYGKEAERVMVGKSISLAKQNSLKEIAKKIMNGEK